MSEIVKTYIQSIPAVRFIGKRFGDDDRDAGGFGKYWGQAFQEDWFGRIEQAAGGAERVCRLYEDAGAYLGLMRAKQGEPFRYYVGEFVPVGTPAPEGFDCVDFPAGKLGVAWIRGKEASGELYAHEDDCFRAIEREQRAVMKENGDGELWFMERYVCPRFTTSDADGKVTLDICGYVEWERTDV